MRDTPSSASLGSRSMPAISPRANWNGSHNWDWTTLHCVSIHFLVYRVAHFSILVFPLQISRGKGFCLTLSSYYIFVSIHMHACIILNRTVKQSTQIYLHTHTCSCIRSRCHIEMDTLILECIYGYVHVCTCMCANENFNTFV